MVTKLADGYEVVVTQSREHIGETGAYRKLGGKVEGRCVVLG